MLAPGERLERYFGLVFLSVVTNFGSNLLVLLATCASDIDFPASRITFLTLAKALWRQCLVGLWFQAGLARMSN